MSFGQNSAKNVEVYQPSFERGHDVLKSRENLKYLAESIDLPKKQLELTESVENFNEEIEKLRNSLKDAKKVIESGGFATKLAMKMSNDFYSIPKMEHEELQVLQRKAPEMYKTFIGATIAAANLLQKEAGFLKEINGEIANAENLEEFESLGQKKNIFVKDIRGSIDTMIGYAKSSYEIFYNNIYN